MATYSNWDLSRFVPSTSVGLKDLHLRPRNCEVLAADGGGSSRKQIREPAANQCPLTDRKGGNAECSREEVGPDAADYGKTTKDS
jgi:hypothetical protein